MQTDKERIATLENEQKNTTEELRQINEKLDSLLALKYKGAGVFWLVSSLVGTGIIGTILAVIDWFR